MNWTLIHGLFGDLNSNITSGALLFWIEAMLVPTSDPELRSTLSRATTKTVINYQQKLKFGIK